MIVHIDDLTGRNEAQPRVRVEQPLNAVRQAHDRDLDSQPVGGLGGAKDDLVRREIAAHGVDGDPGRDAVSQGR
jgi:hypothetical protein